MPLESSASDATIWSVTQELSSMILEASFSIIYDVHVKASLMTMEQRTLKNVNNYLNPNIYSYLETSGG